MEEKVEITNPIKDIIRVIDNKNKLDKEEIKSKLSTVDKKFQYLQSFLVTAIQITSGKKEKYKDFNGEMARSLGQLTSKYISDEYNGKNQAEKIIKAFSENPSLVCPFVESAEISSSKKDVKINVKKCCIDGLINNVCDFSKVYFDNIFIRGFQNMLIENKFEKKEKLCEFFIKIEKMKLFEEL